MEDTFSSYRDAFDLLGRNKGPVILSGLCLLLVFAFLYFFYIPPATDIGPEQPIPFSHHVHSGVKQIQCEFCHPYVKLSKHPGMPPVEKCLYCHKYIIANHPQIKKEHRYFNTRTPTPWRKANYLAEHVVFNHKRHIKIQVACSDCHGAVETMDRIRGVNFKMDFCINCHKKKNANLDCWLACHN
ncbi:MAG: cytochrome c3 family protein [Deltaproteobacteria bacterium]|nr:MAG: cytochrome c3 family protein [Deltaproteobacteria bacterium]